MTVVPVYLISLPRSGSTLLQRLVAAHPEVATTAEPWLMLPLLSVDRTGSFDADFDATVCRHALEDFWTRLPDGRDEYLRAVGSLARTLYTSASGPGKQYFLDKTPRYHLVLDDLQAALPEAKFIVLWRNPLAVAGSMLENGEHWNLYHYEVDLLKGFRNIVEFQRTNREGCLVLHYEDIVAEPDLVLQRISQFLALEPVGIPELGQEPQLEGRVGDKVGTTRYSSVSPDSLNRWKHSLATGARRRWARGYLDGLGAEALAQAGYDLQVLQAELRSVRARPSFSDHAWRSWGVAYRYLNAAAVRNKRRYKTETDGYWGHS
jgi:hypothetical protein